MKFISWNVNGLRAVCGKGFSEVFTTLDADFFCLQETKMQAGQLDLAFPGYQSYWNYADRKGYSGTAIYTRHTPIAPAVCGLPEDITTSVPQGDWLSMLTEGRIITLEYPHFFLITVYTPNSQDGLKRLDQRMIWDDAFRLYLQRLDQQKPVLVCGDMNVAHEEIDIKNPKTNHHNAGFTDEERAKFTTLLQAGFIDTFRHFYPDTPNIYSWWSYRFHAREKNTGWRIDYWLCSQRLLPQLVSAKIHTDILGSDHCPVEVEVQFER